MIKIKIEKGKYTAKLIVLWYANFDENHSPLMRNGKAAIPKTSKHFQKANAERVMTKISFESFSLVFCYFLKGARKPHEPN